MITCLFDEKSNCVTLRASGELGFLRTAQALQWTLEMSPAARTLLVVLEDEAAVRSALELRSLAPVLEAWQCRHPDIAAAVVAPSDDAVGLIADALRRGGRAFAGISCHRGETAAADSLRQTFSAEPLASEVVTAGAWI